MTKTEYANLRRDRRNKPKQEEILLKNSILSEKQKSFDKMPVSKQVIKIDGVEYVVVSHYTGKKNIDEVVGKLAKKQAYEDSENPA